MPIPGETELVTLLRAGDEEAYEQLFRTHAGTLLAVARQFFGDTDDATEAVQDAFVSAFKAMKSFEGTSRLATWLHRITVNACLLKIRNRKRQRLIPFDELMPCICESSDNAVSLDETCRMVRTAVQKLPEPYQTVICLRDLEGLDTETTAQRLGTNTAVVKTRLHRARLALRMILEPHVEEGIV